MRVDEGRNSWHPLAIELEARTVVGRGKSLLSDPGSKLRLGREKDKGKMRKNNIRYNHFKKSGSVLIHSRYVVTCATILQI